MVSYGDTSTPNRSNRDNSYTDINPGPYIAIVKDNVDVTKMGGLKVLIPSLSGTDEGPASMLYDVKYLMPFYGAKSPNATAKTSPYDFNDGPHSYGMWMVPPDIDSKVMVTFVEGKVSQGYWFGCVQDPYTNHMIPGIAASTDTALSSEEGESTRGVAQKYGTNRVPVSEVNRTTWTSASAAGIDKLKKPIHPFADTLQSQGLIEDTVRGTTTSSARRESPSAVFGISTPGRINEAEKKFRLGPTDAKKEVSATRGTGHTFVMDDGDAAGENQLIRLRTGSGHQLLMHDTKGVVYLANGSGNVWMEFSKDGGIEIYAGGGINIRSKGDMNFHSEKDINMYANNNFKIKANQNFAGGGGERSGQVIIDGSDIRTYASRTIHNYAETGWYAVKAGTSIYSQASGQQIHQANGRVDLVGSQVHFNSIGADPFLVQPLKRSDLGTEEISVPDIKLNTVKGANDRDIIVTTPGGRIYVETTIPGMTGMTVPTHEPYARNRLKKNKSKKSFGEALSAFGQSPLSTLTQSLEQSPLSTLTQSLEQSPLSTLTGLLGQGTQQFNEAINFANQFGFPQVDVAGASEQLLRGVVTGTLEKNLQQAAAFSRSLGIDLPRAASELIKIKDVTSAVSGTIGASAELTKFFNEKLGKAVTDKIKDNVVESARYVKQYLGVDIKEA